MKIRNAAFLIFAILFMVPVIVFSSEIVSASKKIQLAKTGIETTAIVYGSGSNSSVNDSEQYYVTYKYTDENDISYKGKSSSRYNDKNTPKKGDTIIIKYNGRDSINADVCWDDYKVDIIGISIFGSIDFVFICLAVIFPIMSYIKKRDINSNGRETYGYYIGCKIIGSVNDDDIYSMTYEYKQNNGERKQNKISDLSEKELRFYRIAKRFKIKEYNGKSIILQKVDYRQLSRLVRERKERETFVAEHKICKHCHSILKKSKVTCSNCGSVDFEDIEE